MTYQKIIKWFYASIIILIMIDSQGLIRTTPGIIEIAIAVYLCMATYQDGWKIKINKQPVSLFVFNLWILPFICIWFFSMVVQLFMGYSLDFYVRTTTVCVRMILYLLLAAMGMKLHKQTTVDALFGACVLSYIPTWIAYFMEYGSGGFILLFDSLAHDMNLPVEIHGMTYVFGFICIYYFYNWYETKRERLWKCILAFGFTFVGLKRIVMFALIATIVMFILLRLVKVNSRYQVVRLGSTTMVGVVFAYLYLIQSGIFERIMLENGINTNFRIQFWNYFRDRYALNPMFVGYGISYPHRIMAHEWSQIEGLGAETFIHNDILAYYLGLGFVGSLLFWGIFFYGRVKFLGRKISKEAAVFSFAASFYYFITMMASNAGMSEFIHGVYFTVVYATVYCCIENQKKLKYALQ